MEGSVTVVGLGPGDPELRTIGACRALADAELIILRTAVHPGVADVADDARTTTCDDLYERCTSFDAVYNAIVDRVLGAARTSQVVYAVPGHPRFGERSVGQLIERANLHSIPVEVRAGVSALDAVSSALGIDLMTEQVQLLDAIDLDARLHADPFGGGLLDVATTRPVLVSQVYSREMASAVKLALSRIFPEDHQVLVATAAGLPGIESVARCPLHQVDQVGMDHLTTVWVPALPSLEASRSAATLHRLASQLRAPGGCPWDRKQTHESLRMATIEEAYEVVDAIDDRDPDHLAEELGDLLLQVALHAQIAEEHGEFTIEDVYDHVNRKLVRRHPHVFGDVAAVTPEDVVTTWQGVKAEERRRRGEPERELDPFEKLPRSMPMLTRIAQVMKPNGTPAKPDSSDVLGDRLLSAVEDLVIAGFDPERELRQAMFRRKAATSA